MQVRISSGELEAIIDQRGAYLTSFKMKGKNVITEGQERQTRGGMAILLPFANRVKGGRYEWKGRVYNLPLNREGNAIHGLVMDKTFQILFKNEREVRLGTELWDQGYPSRLNVEVNYSLGDELRCTISVKNEGDEAPLVVGTHPYFIVKGDWRISPSKGKRCVMREKIPTGEMIDFTITQGDYDDCFYLPGDVILSSNYSRVRISRPGMDFVQLYTGIPGAVAVEPMSGAPDAFNNGIGLITLASGERREFEIEIQVSLVEEG
ncbi:MULTISPECIES: aldose 1-epimerase [Metallosphaera]|uniref:aldose 1-epimerase n=2 Tax=Sulfolobaceae TaxID=118883 RepID=UPI001F0536CE|nr:aldose 1-epimerase [Metallosphaera sedula]MCH1770161.1 aldose 1-epimerase [Metallosphaera sedula]MCP6728005.1 aldose 1-epimerase [Metallosphaera sedula]